MPIDPNPRSHDIGRPRKTLEGERRADVINRLRSARGHIDHILAMIDEDAYVLDLLRQIAAVRGAVDATTRIALRHYFERVFANQVRDGEVESAAGELMTALRFMRQID